MAKVDIDYQSHPKESLEVLLHRYDTQIICINDILSDIDQYTAVCQDLLDIMKWKFEDEEIRNHTYSAERLLKAGAENGIPKEQMLDILEQAKYMGGSKSSLIFQMYRN